MKAIISKCILILSIISMVANSVPVMAAEPSNPPVNMESEEQETQEKEKDPIVEEETGEESDDVTESEEVTTEEDPVQDGGTENPEDEDSIMESDGIEEKTDEDLPLSDEETKEETDSASMIPPNEATEQKEDEETQKDESVVPEAETNEIQPEIQEIEIIEEEPEPGEDDPQGGTAMSYQEASSSVSLFSIGSGYIHNSRYNSGYDIINGIDVSRYNGSINWGQVKDSGIDYVMIRVGFRGYGSSGSLNEDSMFRQNIEGALNVGLKVGVYFFSQAITRTEAREEANYVLDRISGYNISLPVVIDYEYASGNIGRLYDANLSRDYATQICKAFCSTVEAAGYTGMVYANKSMLENNLYADEISSEYKIWLANYTTQTSYAGDYYAWQYSSTGQVSGISGNVDCNFFYEKTVPQVSAEDAERYVVHLYETLLERSADASGLATYTTALKNGSATASSVANALISSTEFQNKKYSNETYVKKLYLALLGRNAGTSEVNEWVEKLETGVSRTYILAQIAGSAEFQNVCNSYKITRGSIQLTENRDKNYSATAYVMRCYKAILGRTADTTGLNTWTGRILSGDGGAEIVRELVFSKEFENKKKTDAQVVEILYQAMLGRSSDPAGKSDWLSRLESGVSYVYVINGFAGSSEFTKLCNGYGIAPGRAVVSEARDRNIGVTQFVNRNYQTVLGRNGEAAGLNNWCAIILNKSQSPAQVAYGFVFSEECKNKNLSNSEFVEMLYGACLGRTSDPSGKSDWVNQLNRGTSRENVFWGFANSVEFNEIVAGYGL